MSTTTPGLLFRVDNRVEMIFKNSPDIRAWRIRAANSLAQAASSTQILFTVQRGGQYRSSTIKRKRWLMEDGGHRGTTRMLWDPADFEDPANNVPGDDVVSYLRIQEQNAAGVWRSEGPIYVLPTGDFFSTEQPSLSLNGTAPAALLGATEVPPSGALHVVMPRPVATVTVRNTGSNDLRVGTVPGNPMLVIPSGEAQDLFDAHDKSLYFCVDHAVSTTTFSCYIAQINGPQ